MSTTTASTSSSTARTAAPGDAGSASAMQRQAAASRSGPSQTDIHINRSQVAERVPDTTTTTRSNERLRNPSLPASKSISARLPDPRPLPPPAPEGDDDLTSIRLALGRNALWSPTLGVFPSQPEPELPPSVPDAVSSTPPRGIHSSPSRWRAKSKSKSRNRTKGTDRDGDRDKARKESSPLKPTTMSRPGLKAQLSLRGAAPSQEGLAAGDVAPSVVPLHERTHPARQVPAHDVDADKRKQRDALREEIARLKQDLLFVNKENEHIRLMQSSGRVISSQDEDAVLDVIQRHMIDAMNPAPAPASQQLARAALSATGLGLLLPLGRSAAAPLVPAPEEADHYSDIKSHRPVPMTADEELPFLQLFSPFTVTSTIAVLPQLPNQPVRQRRVMALRSKDGLGLFTSKLEMVVDALNLNILELKVLALEPAARAELGPFADKICGGDCNRSMQRNVGILAWAMGEWYRVALRRARLWAQLHGELAGEGELLRATTEMRRRKKRRRREDDDSDGEEEKLAQKKSRSTDTATIRRYLGQRFFDLDIPPREPSEPSSPISSSSLRLEWIIEFDWTGEAQSKVACLIGVPGKWRNADGRDVLGKLPQLFRDLVDGGEDLSTATKTMAALLVGDRGDRTD